MTDINRLVPAGLPDWLAPHAEEVAVWGPAPVARGCWVAGCRRDAHLHGLCKTHHRRAKRAWDPVPSERRAESAGVVPAHDAVPTTTSTTDAEEAQR